ncbi:MAG: GtrA family protein [bacterium]|nr:GtrA family protein [bacterium]
MSKKRTTKHQTSKSKRSSQKNNRYKREFKRFAEYMVGGGVWFWSGYLIISLLDNHIGLAWANVLGQTVGITLNFLVQKYWAFKTSDGEKIAFTARRYIIYTAINAYGLNYLILKGFDVYFGIAPEISQFIASAFFTGWNYFWYKVWVFPDTKHPTRQHAKPRVRKIHRHITTNV